MLVRQNFNDTIYTYDQHQNNLSIRYVFDFENSKLPYQLLSSYELFNKEYENYAYLSDVSETNDYIYVDYVFHGKNKKVIIDKSNDQILTVQDPIGGITVKNGFHFFWPKWVSTEYLIDYIPADYIIRYKDKIKNEKLSELVELLDEESNPILILSKK